MHMQPMHVYAEKEDSFINVEVVVHTYIHTYIPEWIYNKIDAFLFERLCVTRRQNKVTK
jgi:hypothetical protein